MTVQLSRFVPVYEFSKNNMIKGEVVLQNCMAYKIVVQFVLFYAMGVHRNTDNDCDEVVGLILTNMTVRGYS